METLGWAAVGLWEVCEDLLLNAPSSAFTAPHRSFNSPLALQEAPWRGKGQQLAPILRNTDSVGKGEAAASCLLASGPGGYGGERCSATAAVANKQGREDCCYLPTVFPGAGQAGVPSL